MQRQFLCIPLLWLFCAYHLLLLVDDQPSAFNTLAEYLRALYKRSPLPTKNKWPPTPSKYYINLACVSGETVSHHEMDEFTRSTVLGNIEAIYARKEHISIEQVACKVNKEYHKTVLVEGAPGVGKTTFAWELCRRWADGRLLQHYSLVLLLRLRDKSVREAKELQDIFFHPSKSIRESVYEKVVTENGQGILIILEGFDELPENLRKSDSFFCRLIDGELPLATVLVTSRPWATLTICSDFCNSVSQRIEILGFTSDLLDEFLISVTKEDTNLLHKMRQYIEVNPPIYAAMYIPLNAVIIFETCKEEWRNDSNAVVPVTMTELHISFSKTLLVRYIRAGDTNHKKLINKFTDLPLPVYEKFCALCKIAYKGIRNRQQLVFEDIPEGLEELGFMQSVSELHVSSGSSVSYNFLHLTLQEFLSAYYLSLQLQQPGYDLVHIDKVPDMRQVYQYLAGITHLKNGIMKEMLPTYKDNKFECFIHDHLTNSSSKYRTTSNVIVNAYHCRLLYESQNLAVLESSLGCKDASMEFYSFYGDPMRYFAAGWCIGHSKCQWKLFIRNVIPPDCAKMLISGVQQCKQLSNSLKVCELYIGCELSNFSCSFDSLDIVKKLRQSICFDLHRIFLYVDVTSQVWSHRNALNVLPFFGRIVSESGSLSEVEVSVSAGNDLFCSPIGEVTDHSFWPFCIRSESYLPQFFRETFLERSLRRQPIVEMLQPCSQLLHAVLQLKSLKTLTLHRDICLCFTTSDISLVRNCSLESLTIMCYYDYIYNFGELTSALSLCISLKELNLCINFYFEGYSVHTKRLLSKLDLTSLSLQNCNLTDIKGALVLKPLALKTNLSILKIAENDLGEKSCAVIADILKGTTLKKLDISDCKLPLNGIVNIMEALSLNTTLTDLNIGGNECTGGSGALSSMLCTNVTLTTHYTGDGQLLIHTGRNCSIG